MIDEGQTDGHLPRARRPNEARPVIAPPKTGCSGDTWIRSASEISVVEPSLAERGALGAGMRAADAALASLDQFDVVQLFVRKGRPTLGDPRLEALSAYAEVRRALLSQDRVVPAASLSALGYTNEQIAQFDAIIASASATGSKI